MIIRMSSGIFDLKNQITLQQASKPKFFPLDDVFSDGEEEARVSGVVRN